MTFKNLKQRGDTIVEVLIASVVVSTVLVGSISIANNSLKSIRMAQERSEGQKIAQSSVESMERVVSAKPTLITDITVAPFCIGSGSTTVNVPDIACNSGGRYTTEITRSGGTARRTFTVTVSWLGVKNTNEFVAINYRVRQ